MNTERQCLQSRGADYPQRSVVPGQRNIVKNTRQQIINMWNLQTSKIQGAFAKSPLVGGFNPLKI